MPTTIYSRCWEIMETMRILKIKQCAYVLIFLGSIAFLLIYYYMDISNKTELKRKRLRLLGYLKRKRNSPILSERPNLRIYDLTKPLKPDIYDSIKCRKSGVYQKVTTTLCLHESVVDIVSKEVWINGLWEEHIMRVFTFYVRRHPDWLVVDAGAQIGQYSLIAAKLGARVITIEPFYENIIRLHKASLLENLGHRIILVKNALFDKRNQIKELSVNRVNVGGQSLIHYQYSEDSNNKSFDHSELSRNEFLVETIIFDDLIEVLPTRTHSGHHRLAYEYQKAIVKIDIEGLEPFVITKAEIFFELIDVQLVFMEWGKLPQMGEFKLKIEEMIEFFISRDFVPYSVDEMKLNVDRWASWPWDMYWINKDLI